MRFKCPKCDVSVEMLDGGLGWLFDPGAACVDLRGTPWGAAGEYEWCPTLAATLPPTFFWPGVTHKDEVEKAITALDGK
jgi:hypothetical protein